ncbi:hypothetical protein ACWGQ5_06745 [Streptomyces sp. NPDC055722]
MSRGNLVLLATDQVWSKLELPDLSRLAHRGHHDGHRSPGAPHCALT